MDHTIPVIDRKACVACEICVEVCPEDALGVDQGKIIYTQPQKCTYCGLCEELCPYDAIRCEFSISWEEKEEKHE